VKIEKENVSMKSSLILLLVMQNCDANKQQHGFNHFMITASTWHRINFL